MEREPLVSVLCTAFNHGRFIRSALEGFVSQRTDFPFEVIVHDDASTDDTASIIREFADRYPDVIKPILQTENQYSKERGKVTRIVHAAARGRYIATCEGDDYWVDPEKLRDQVALLEREPGLSGCFTDAWNETDGEREAFYPSLLGKAREAGGIDLEGLLADNIVPSATLLARRERMFPAPEQMFTAPAGDWMLLVHLAKQGRLGFIDRKTAVRRRHTGGAISMKGREAMTAMTVGCLQHIRTMVDAKYHKRIADRITELRRSTLEEFIAADDQPAALRIWSTFKGQGFSLREQLRYRALLFAPRLMRTYHRLRT